MASALRLFKNTNSMKDLVEKPDWRWLLLRQDSVWYPTMRHFLQRRCSDWDEAFAGIANELKRL
jgi:hypothetical protein